MEYRLLGPLEVLRDGAPVPLRGQRLRALLAVLLLHANRTVTAEQLIDDVWGGAPPASERRALQYAVHRLRQVLADGRGPDAGGRILLTESGGYRLLVGDDALDLTRFEGAARRGRRAQAAGDLGGAAAAFAEALDTWRGPALADLASEPFARPVAARLEEERLLVVEERAALALELGPPAGLVDELEALVAEHPFRERLCGQLMLALYRSGRREDALGAFQALRRRLVEGLGIEPGSELRRLEQQILGQDPILARTGRPAGAGGPARGPEERRVVTVMAASAVPVSAGGAVALGDPEDERERRVGLLGPIFGAVSQYGGTVLSVLGGTVLAVFGVPRARDDDPERAVRAALAVCQAAPDGAAVRVGVDTGETIIAPGGYGVGTGGTAAAAGGVSGEVLDGAAALAAAAPPGQTLVGQAAWRATRRRIHYEPAGERVWRALGPRSLAGPAVEQGDLERQPPLTERQHELALLARMLDRVRLGRTPQLVTLTGAPGIGKTRLVSELGRQAERDPELITWRQGRSLPYGQRDDVEAGQAGFWAVAEIVRAHAGIHDLDPTDAVDAKLDAVVTDLFPTPEEAAGVAWHLRRLLRPAAADDAPTDERAAATAWAAFFEAVADDRPLVLVFEDLHWADSELLDFVEQLPGRVGPVPLLIVCTTRPELASRRPHWGGGNPNTVSISLGPLSRAGSEALLDALLDAEAVKPLDDATRAEVVARAGGNPLFLEEYVRMLRDRPEDPGLSIPETVQQLITARVDALGDDRRLLQDLAVLGESAALGALVALAEPPPPEPGGAAGDPAERIRAGLARLERQEMVRRARGTAGEELVYVFRHTLIREVAYRQLVRADRSARHRRAARWLAHRPDPPVEVLAYHYGQALALDRADGRPADDLYEPARLALRAAGDRSMALGEFRAATRHYRDALPLWPEHHPERAAVLAGLGTALMYAEHAGFEQLVAARSAFDAAGDTARVVQMDGQLGTLALLRGEDAGAYVDRARAAQPALTLESAVAHAAGVGQLLYSGRTVEGAAVARELLARAEEAGMEPAAGLFQSLLGMAMNQLGQPGGEALTGAAMRRLRAIRFPMLATVGWAVAWNLWWAGQLPRCAAVVAETREVVEPGDATAAFLDVVDASLAYASGRWDAPAVMVDRLVAASGMEHGFVLPWAYDLRGRVRLGRGDTAGALADAEASVAVAEGQPGNWFGLISGALRCRALLAAGRRDEAATEAESLLTEIRARPVAAHASPDLAHVLAELGYPAGTLPDGLPPITWHLAARALVDGDPEEAARHYDGLGSPTDAAGARLRAAAGHAAAGRAAEARSVLAPAVTLWRGAGAVAHLRAAERLLAGP